MNKLIFGIALLLGLPLTACGEISSDGRLSITRSALATNYRITGSTTSVGCDLIDGVPAVTYVRATFNTDGFLKAIDIGLFGLSDSTYDDLFRTSFQQSRNEFTQDASNQIRVLFQANTQEGQFLPTAKEGQIQSQGIVVTPVGSQIPVKEVTVRNKVGQGFEARVVATSDRNARTGSVPSLNTIPVYRNCEFVRNTATNL